MRSSAQRLLLGCAAVGSLLAAAPAIAADPDISYTGVAKGWPVAIRVAQNGRQVVLAGIGLDLKCGSGGGFSEPDVYGKLSITKTGTFKAAYAGQLVDNGGGRFSLYSGEMHARFNRARTVVTGTWHVHDTERDAIGTTTDQCDSGAVRFTAQR
jgi:hypothetical protein